MAAVQSLQRNLEAEDAAIKRNIAACEAEMFDGEAGPEAMEESDMNIMAARDVYVTPSAGQPNPVPTTSPPPPTVPPPSPVTPPAVATPLWKKVLTTAALVGTGAGAGAGIPWLAGAFDKPAAIEQAGYGLDLQKFVPTTPPAEAK